MATPNTGFTVIGQQIKRVFQEQTFPIVDQNDCAGGLKSVTTASLLSALINVKPFDLAIAQDTGIVYQYQLSAPSTYTWVQWFVPNQQATTVDAVTNLLALTASFQGNAVTLSGYYGAGTKGGGQFIYVASDVSSATNHGTIFVDTIGRRWYRILTGLVTPEMFGVKFDGATDDWQAWTYAVNAGSTGKAWKLTIQSGGTSLLSKNLVLPTTYELAIEGIGEDDCILNFTITDGSWGISQGQITNDQCRLSLTGFGVFMGGSSGDAVHIDYSAGGQTRAGPTISLRIQGASNASANGATGAVGLYINSADIVDVTGCFFNDNYNNHKFINCNSVTGRYLWSSGAIGTELSLDANCIGCYLIYQEMGLSSPSATVVAMSINGNNNCVVVTFMEGYINPRAIAFGLGSFENKVMILGGAPNGIYDLGQNNQYTAGAYEQNVDTFADGQVLRSSLAAGAASTNQKYTNNVIFDDGIGANYLAQSPDAPTLSIDSTKGISGSYSIKAIWGTTTSPGGAIGVKTVNMVAGDRLVFKAFVQQSRALSADEFFQLQIVDGSGNLLSPSKYYPQFPATDPMECRAAYTATGTITVKTAFKILRTSTTTALTSNLILPTLVLNGITQPFQFNYGAGATTRTALDGLLSPIARLQRLSVDVGDGGRMGAVGLLASPSVAAGLGNTSNTESLIYQFPSYIYQYLKAGFGVGFKINGICAANANAKTVNVYLGGANNTIDGTLIATTGAAAANNKTFQLSGQIWSQNSTTMVAISDPGWHNNAAVAPVDTLAISLAFGANPYLKLTGLGGATNDLVLHVAACWLFTVP